MIVAANGLARFYEIKNRKTENEAKNQRQLDEAHSVMPGQARVPR